MAPADLVEGWRRWRELATPFVPSSKGYHLLHELIKNLATPWMMHGERADAYF